MFEFELPTLAADHAVWVINEIADEARLRGTPLTQADLALLREDVAAILPRDEMRPVVFQLNNRVVPLIRARIERRKSHRVVQKVKVRRGLTLPMEWHQAYVSIHNSGLSWLVSFVLQNAILNNSFGGEKKPWKSK